MERKDVDEIIACLPQDRSLFRYFKDYYVLQLLGWAAGDGIALERLKRSAFGPLLHKPAARPPMLIGRGTRRRRRLGKARIEPSFHRLTL